MDRQNRIVGQIYGYFVCLAAVSLLVFAGHWMWLRKRGRAAA